MEGQGLQRCEDVILYTRRTPHFAWQCTVALHRHVALPPDAREPVALQISKLQDRGLTRNRVVVNLATILPGTCKEYHFPAGCLYGPAADRSSKRADWQGVVEVVELNASGLGDNGGDDDYEYCTSCYYSCVIINYGPKEVGLRLLQVKQPTLLAYLVCQRADILSSKPCPF